MTEHAVCSYYFRFFLISSWRWPTKVVKVLRPRWCARFLFKSIRIIQQERDSAQAVMTGARLSTSRHGRNLYVFVLFSFTPDHIMVTAHKGCQGAKTEIMFSVSFWIDTKHIAGAAFSTSRHDRTCFVFVLFSSISGLIGVSAPQKLLRC